MTEEKKGSVAKVLLWLLGTSVAAIIGWLFSGLPTPFEESCKVENVEVRLKYSSRTQGLVTTIERELKKCDVDFRIDSHDYNAKTSNVRYYTSGDKEKALALVEWLNDIAAGYPQLNIRFVPNSRVGEVSDDRTNRLHVYLAK